MVSRGYLPVVGRYDGAADGQADAHALVGVRAGTALEGTALKHGSQKLGINPLSVIFDRECGKCPVF